jgi:hypothetical protein
MMKKRHRAVLLTLILVWACQEAPDLANDDGIPASAESVRDAVRDAWGPEEFDGATIMKNEKAWFSRTAQLFAQPPREFEISLQDVKDIQIVPETENGVTTNYRDVHILVSKKDVSEGSTKPQIDQLFTYRFDVLEPAPTPVANPSEAITYDQSQQDAIEPISLHTYVLYATACFHDETIDWKPYCYNLKTSESLEPAPYFVAQKPDCGGLKDCKMKVTKISYDLVSELADSETGRVTRQKNIIVLKISRDLPYLSRFVSVCFQGMGSFNQQPYVATVCTDVVDFERGGTTTP